MNVTFVIGSLGYGGKERQLGYLIQHLPSSIKIQLIVLSEDIKYNNILNRINDIIVVPRNRKYNIKTIFDLYKRVKRFDPNIIHSWDVISPLLFKPLVLLTKIKLINGSLRTSGPQLQLFKKRFNANLLIKISDKSVANSYACIHSLGLKESKNLKCIHNGFNYEEFLSKVESNSNLVPKNQLSICMVGRFYESKDYQLLIDAAKLLSESNLAFQVACVGDGPLIDTVKKKVLDYGLTNINFLGNRDDIPSIISNCDIGVLLNPSNRAEGISNAIMEYMATGLPVVATNAGGTPELVVHKITGYLIESGDVNQLKTYLKELLENKTLREEMGDKGRERIKKEFSIDAMINSYLSIYNEVLD